MLISQGFISAPTCFLFISDLFTSAINVFHGMADDVNLECFLSHFTASQTKPTR